MQLNALCKQCKLLFNAQTLRCMKITAFILLAFCLHVSAASLAQNVTLSEHKAPLEKVLNDIRQQTGYVFFYNQDWMQQAHPVDIDVKEVSLEKALQVCFSDQPYDYAIVNKTIVLKLKAARQTGKIELPEPVNVSGKVTDSLGTPLIGATVAIKDKGKATITNENGEFTISADIGDNLLVSYIGYKPLVVTVSKNLQFLNLILHPNVNGLTEVTVSTGYQKLSAERATGSFAFVDSVTFDRRVSNTILVRLEGVVPGLLVNRNVSTVNNPNGIDISIRGTSTLFSNNQPLIVVDNFPYDGNIQDINPEDVENVTVLKDAAAASIWGVRAGNGVIVVTTKKGHRNQKLAIDVNANVTIGDKPNLFYNPNFMDSKDFISVEESLFSQGFYDSRLTSSTEEPVSPVVQLLANERSGLISSADANSQINSFENIDVRNGLQKYFYRKSVDQQYYMNFKGGGQNNDFIYSAGYDNYLSNLVGNGNKRINLSAVNNFYLFKNFTLSTGLYFTQTYAKNNSTLGGLAVGGNGTDSPYGTIYPYAQFADNSGNPLPIVKDYNYQWITDPTAQQGRLNWQYVPLDELRNANNTSKSTDNRINVGLNYKFFDGLSADIKYQYETSTTNSQNNYSEATYYARNLINEYINLTAANPNPIPIGGILQQNQVDLSSERARAQLNYSKNLGSHQLTSILGSEIDQTVVSINTPNTLYGYNSSNGTNVNVDFVDFFNVTPGFSRGRIPSGGGQGKTTDRYVGYFGNASDTYLGKYTFSASARIDKSNLFGVNTNQKSVPLYSLGALWDVNKENFYHISWLPYFKLRLTYGYNGNVNTYATAVTTIQQLSSGYFSSFPYAQIHTPGNPELRWEKIRMINYAVDFGSKNNILTGSFEYYQKKGTDLYGTTPLAPSTGFTSINANTANISGNGLDMSLTWKVIHAAKLKWTSNFIYSYAFDKVTKYDVQFPASLFLSSNADAGSITPVAGMPIYSIYSFPSGPLTHDSGSPQGYLNGQLSTDYAQIINTATFNSLKFNGSARPTSFGSFRNTISYQNWSVSANVVYKFGYYFRRSSINYQGLFNAWSGNQDFVKRWMQPGDETKTIVPSMPTFVSLNPSRENFYMFEDKLVDKGDHIRLQDINLNYTIRKPKFLGGVFNDISVYGYINNVGILWRANHDHLDPDLYSGALPQPRTFSIGIKTDF